MTWNSTPPGCGSRRTTGWQVLTWVPPLRWREQAPRAREPLMLSFASASSVMPYQSPQPRHCRASGSCFGGGVAAGAFAAFSARRSVRIDHHRVKTSATTKRMPGIQPAVPPDREGVPLSFMGRSRDTWGSAAFQPGKFASVTSGQD